MVRILELGMAGIDYPIGFIRHLFHDLEMNRKEFSSLSKDAEALSRRLSNFLKTLSSVDLGIKVNSSSFALE